MAATPLGDLAAAAGGGTRARRLYFEDTWTWSREQADALRRRDIDAIDWENVIEEVEDVGNRHYDRWESNCRQAISHLLKIEHYRSVESLAHWQREVRQFRQAMFRALRRNQGIKGKFADLLADAWADGREDAAGKMAEYGASGPAEENRLHGSWRLRLPADCPYALEDIAGYDPYQKKGRPRDDVWPAAVARVLNEGLGTDYPVRYRAPVRGGGRSR